MNHEMYSDAKKEKCKIQRRESNKVSTGGEDEAVAKAQGQV